MIKFTVNPTGLRIIDVGAYFDTYVLPNMLEDDICAKMMGSIDEAILIDSSIGTISTKFGVTSYQDLSNGCKTAIFIGCLDKGMITGLGEDVSVDLVSCGWNAIKEIISLGNLSIKLIYSSPDVGDMDGLFDSDGVLYTNIADLVFSSFER